MLRAGPGRSSVDVYLDGFAFHHQQLESANPCARVSGSVLEYFALLRSGLAKTETCHVLAQANTSYSFPRLGQLLRDQYPEGSHNCRHLHSAAVHAEAKAPSQPEQTIEVEDLLSFRSFDEEESDCSEMAEDSADQEQADGLQAILASV